MAAPVRQMDLESTARLVDPTFYANQPELFDVYARLRAEDPVFWYEPSKMWALSKFDDVRFVSRNPDFSTAYGVTPTESIPFDDGSEVEETGMGRRAELRRRAVTTRFGPGSEPLLVTDAPRHTVLRKLVSYAFTPRFIASLTDRIEEHTKQALDRIEPHTVTDLVDALAVPVPMHTIGEMVGVQEADRDAFVRWADALVAANDLLTKGPESPEVAAFNAQLLELAGYFAQALMDREQSPQDDLLTAIVKAEADGERLDLMNQLTMVLILILGGNETTRNLIAGGAKLLADHPDQRQLLIDDPSRMSGAVEELLRCVTPIHSTCRTATAPTEIRGRTIERGDYVVLLYGAANRDEDVWENAEALDIRRPADPMHQAFGYGTHFCLGAALARNQARIVFEGLLRRFPHYELAGPVERLASTGSNGIKRMPVYFA